MGGGGSVLEPNVARLTLANVPAHVNECFAKETLGTLGSFQSNLFKVALMTDSGTAQNGHCISRETYLRIAEVAIKSAITRSRVHFLDMLSSSSDGGKFQRPHIQRSDGEHESEEQLNDNNLAQRQSDIEQDISNLQMKQSQSRLQDGSPLKLAEYNANASRVTTKGLVELGSFDNPPGPVQAVLSVVRLILVLIMGTRPVPSQTEPGNGSGGNPCSQARVRLQCDWDWLALRDMVKDPLFRNRCSVLHLRSSRPYPRVPAHFMASL